MKKIKTLLTIPTLVAILPMTISLTQCAKTDSRVPSVEGEVNMDTLKNADGSITCCLSPKSNRQKITDISIEIGTNTLTAGTDYEINTNTINLKIFKTALDKYSGDIVVKPTLANKEFSGLIVQLTQKQFMRTKQLTIEQMEVYQSLEGTQGDLIPWSDDKLLVKGSDGQVITNFKTKGFTFESIGTYNFSVCYDSLTKAISIECIPLTYTITTSIKSNAIFTIPSSFKVEEGKTWGEVKPTPVPKTDVDSDAFEFIWEKDGTVIQDTDPINESFTATLTYRFKEGAEEQSPISFELYRNWKTAFNCNCYVYGDKATETAKPTQSNYNFLYSFKMNLNNIGAQEKVKYFWVGYKTDSNDTGLLLIYPESIYGIYLDVEDETHKVAYSISDDKTYITFTNSYAQGDDHTMIVKYRPTVSNDIDMYPGFQVII